MAILANGLSIGRCAHAQGRRLPSPAAAGVSGSGSRYDTGEPIDPRPAEHDTVHLQALAHRLRVTSTVPPALLCDSTRGRRVIGWKRSSLGRATVGQPAVAADPVDRPELARSDLLVRVRETAPPTGKGMFGVDMASTKRLTTSTRQASWRGINSTRAS